MNLNQIQTTKYPDKKRLGRGIGSGSGKTAGRGTKGQNSRTGGGVKIGFEGGQTKLSMRLPKVRGFKAKNPTNYQIITLTDLENLKSNKIDKTVLVEAKLVDPKGLVKLLNNGEITKKVDLNIDAASKNAVAKIEKIGGTVKITKAIVSEQSKPAKIESKSSPKK